MQHNNKISERVQVPQKKSTYQEFIILYRIKTVTNNSITAKEVVKFNKIVESEIADWLCSVLFQTR